MHRRRLKGGERILKAYEENPESILETLDEEHSLFRMRSESSPSTYYDISLNSHFCNCASEVSTCKHIIGMEFIMAKHFPSLQCDNEELHFQESFVEVDNIEMTTSMTIESSFAQKKSASDKGSHHVEEFSSLLEEMEVLIGKTKFSMHDFTIEELEHKMDLAKKFISSFKEPFTFERPPRIALPSKGSILSLIHI